MLCEVHYICLGSATLPKDWTVNIVLGGEGGIKKKVHDKIWLSSILQRVFPIFYKTSTKTRTENVLCYPAFHTVMATDESLMTCSSLNSNKKFVLMTSMMTSQHDVIKCMKLRGKLTINGPFLTDKSN